MFTIQSNNFYSLKVLRERERFVSPSFVSFFLFYGIVKHNLALCRTWNWQITKLSVQYPVAAELPYLRSVVVCRPAWYHLHLSPLYNVLDHTNPTFSESL